MPIDTSQSIDNTSKPKVNDSYSSQYNLTMPLYTIDNLILPKSTLNSIQNFLSYQKYSDLIFNRWGLSNTHSNQKQIAVNLYGVSGTGKTMAAHAIAHSFGKPLIIVDYSEIESKYVGETSKNITALFHTAVEQDAIIFFDEADAILSRRVTNMSSSTDVSVNQTRSVLLTLMNHHEGLIIFTTNFIENYDPAFMRRILAHILFELPDTENRKNLWNMYIPKGLPHDADIEDLAKLSSGLSGSDISNCVLKAAFSAARENLNMVTRDKFIE
ncbi:MAG: ATP-binding protein, partial [Vagococcus sp.]|nr:ATP-binding protein [Vagococcus sp.]